MEWVCKSRRTTPLTLALYPKKMHFLARGSSLDLEACKVEAKASDPKIFKV
jgi:hypothetical protein